MNTSTELMVLTDVDPLKVFVANGLDPIIAKIEKEVQAEAPDISTEEGRERIASLAYKVAKSKTALDKMGKDLTDEWRTKTAAVNVERSRAWDKLEALQKKVRQPLTEWEEKEKSRVAKHEENLAIIESNMNTVVAGWQSLSEEDMGKQLEAAKKFIDYDWQEFGQRGQYVVEQAITTIGGTIAKRKKYDAEQLELEQLRKEKAERERVAAEEKTAKEKREREDKIAQDATDKARKDAEEAAEKKRKEEADAAEKKREEDKAHNAKINNDALYAVNEIVEAFAKTGNNPAKAIVEAIARGKIPHVSIKY